MKTSSRRKFAFLTRGRGHRQQHTNEGPRAAERERRSERQLYHGDARIHNGHFVVRGERERGTAQSHLFIISL